MLNFCPVDTKAEVETCWLFVTADIFLHFLFLSFCVSMCLHVCIFTFLHYCVFEFSNPFCIFLTQGQKLWHVGFLWHGQSFLWTHTTCQKYQRQDILAKTHISINSSSLYVCEISINRNVLLFQVPTHTPVEVVRKVLDSSKISFERIFIFKITDRQ